MALPSDIYTCVVTGSFRDAGGVALAGTVTFTPSTTLADSAGTVVIPAYAKPYQLTAGALHTDALAATDNADLTPSGWTYLVTVALANLQQYSYNVLIPAAPLAFTATNATPCVFTATGSAYANGTAVTLTGASIPAGFTAGTTYYVVSTSGASFSLAATSGGSAIASTGTGSGTVSAASVDISALQPVVSQGTPVSYVPTSGGTYTGTVVFDGSPALQIPSGAATGQVLTSDSSGNAVWAAPALVVKPSVQEATTAALPANAYVSGVLTASSNGALTVDGIAVPVSDRVLVKNEVAAANNGIYTATSAGSAGTKYVLTRAADFNVAADVPGAFVFVERGTVNAGQGYMVTGAGPFTIGSTAIPWTQFSASPASIQLTPTAVKTSAYTASPGDFVLCDTQTTGAFTVTLPTAPADKTTIGAKMVKQTSPNAVTIAAGGSDTFNADASTTASLKVLNEAGTFQYDAALTAWIRIGNDLPLSQMDARYFPQAQSIAEVNNTYQTLFSVQSTGGTDSVDPFQLITGSATFGGILGPIYAFGYNALKGQSATTTTNGAAWMTFFADAGDTNSSGAHGVEAEIGWCGPSNTGQTLAFQMVAVNDTTNTVNTKIKCGSGSSGSYTSGITLASSGGSPINFMTCSVPSNNVVFGVPTVQMTQAAASTSTNFFIIATGTTSSAQITIDGTGSGGTLYGAINFRASGTTQWQIQHGTAGFIVNDATNAHRHMLLQGSATDSGAVSTLYSQVQVQDNLIVTNGTQLATNASHGYLYIPSCAGVPTGTPTTKTGSPVPIVLDVTDSKLYAYISGSWKGVVLS